MDSTVSRTSLANLAKARRLQIIVSAFHGYAHNHKCQLQFHPVYREGMGLEDFETAERLFSGIDPSARLIRHASNFHWMQYIDLALRQSDSDRYGELGSLFLHGSFQCSQPIVGNFLLGNYKQALTMITEYEHDVKLFQEATGYTDADFEQWHTEEHDYLNRACHKEHTDDEQKVAYVEALQKLDATR